MWIWWVVGKVWEVEVDDLHYGFRIMSKV
jgi:hypothetical protein